MAKKETTPERYQGYLLWCLAMLIDDMNAVTIEFANHKPLAELTKSEFVIENADMSLAVVYGQLADMGIDVDKMLAVCLDFKSGNQPEDYLKLIQKD